jgi:Cdc6-like AAA superfamily ATPase
MAYARKRLSPEEALNLDLLASKTFRPRTPIATRDLFAGRWDQIQTLVDAVNQTGLHAVIYGERGVGKTSLSNVLSPIVNTFDEVSKNKRIIVKTIASSEDTFSTIWHSLFGQITWRDNRPVYGMVQGTKNPLTIRKAFELGDTLTVDEVRKVVSLIPNSVYIIDEFDRAAHNASRNFTDLMKALSDFSVECTVILVGVAETIDALISDHASISRALVQVLLPRMRPEELREILTKAEESLSIKFTDEGASLIVNLSQGLPHYTHLLGLHSVRMSAAKVTNYIERDAVFDALKEAVRQAQQSVTEKHTKATRSAHQDALYRHVLLGCALAATHSRNALGYFNPGSVAGPLSRILNRSVQIAAFSHHLSEFCSDKRAEVLERTGQQRSYRFRFRDPLLVPYVLMDAMNSELISRTGLAGMLGQEF